jgi:hypothetical protein
MWSRNLRGHCPRRELIPTTCRCFYSEFASLVPPGRDIAGSSHVRHVAAAPKIIVFNDGRAHQEHRRVRRDPRFVDGPHGTDDKSRLKAIFRGAGDSSDGDSLTPRPTVKSQDALWARFRVNKKTEPSQTPNNLTILSREASMCVSIARRASAG